MLQDLVRAFAELRDPRIRRVVLISIGLAVLTFILLLGVVQGLLYWLGETPYHWLNWIIGLAGAAGTAVVAWLLFPAVLTSVVGLFLDRVVDATEDNNFPTLPAAKSPSMTASIVSSVRLALTAIVLNLLVIPAYFVPVLNVAVFVLLNGYLLGREYFELVAMRRLSSADVSAAKSRWRTPILIVGGLVALLSLVPVVNLVAPVIGAALMTLRFHRLTGRAPLMPRATN
ncbi:MAG: EI24 domain-containing protein [Geminicoccaceae bacterium]